MSFEQSIKLVARSSYLFLFSTTTEICLEFFKKFARRAGYVDSARDTAFAVFHAFDDARFLPALGAVG